MNTSVKFLTTALLSSLLACASGPGEDNQGADAGTQVDAGKPGKNPFLCDYPLSGYGSEVNKKLEPFKLTNCDGSGDWQFVNQEFCDSKLTVMSIAAGWCKPC